MQVMQQSLTTSSRSLLTLRIRKKDLVRHLMQRMQQSLQQALTPVRNHAARDTRQKKSDAKKGPFGTNPPPHHLLRFAKERTGPHLPEEEARDTRESFPTPFLNFPREEEAERGRDYLAAMPRLKKMGYLNSPDSLDSLGYYSSCMICVCLCLFVCVCVYLPSLDIFMFRICTLTHTHTHTHEVTHTRHCGHGQL